VSHPKRDPSTTPEERRRRGRTAKAKGARNELRTARFFEKDGWVFTKSGGSLGIWDLIGLREGPYWEIEVLAVQVKTNTWPGPEERKQLAGFLPRVRGLRRVMVRWNNGARTPEVREV
jgi:hypothetical protein